MDVIGTEAIDAWGATVSRITVHFMNGDTKEIYVARIHKDEDGIIHFVGEDSRIACSAPITGIAYWD